MINQRVFLLVLLIKLIFLLLIYFNAFTAPSPSSISIEIYQQQIENSNLSVRNDKEPIIFSKSKYFKKTRKVKLFSFSHWFFILLYYYCSLVRMLLLT
jgi:hypothetical protein